MIIKLKGKQSKLKLNRSQLNYKRNLKPCKVARQLFLFHYIHFFRLNSDFDDWLVFSRVLVHRFLTMAGNFIAPQNWAVFAFVTRSHTESAKEFCSSDLVFYWSLTSQQNRMGTAKFNKKLPKWNFSSLAC